MSEAPHREAPPNDLPQELGFDLRELRHLLMLSETRHFGKAAAALGISQPALTKSIRKLEHSVGAKLFNRGSGNVGPTLAGELLIEEGRRVFEQAQFAQRQMEHHVAEGRPVLSLGIVAAILPDVLPPAIVAFKDLHPDIELRLQLDTTEYMIADLRRGVLDAAAITPLSDEALDFVVRYIRKSSFVAAIPPKHRFSGNDHVTLESLAGQYLVMLQQSLRPTLRQAFITACWTAGFIPNIIQEVPRYELALDLVAGGLGIGLMPEISVRLAPPGVKIVPIVDLPPFFRSDVALAWLPGRNTGPLGDLIRLIREQSIDD